MKLFIYNKNKVLNSTSIINFKLISIINFKLFSKQLLSNLHFNLLKMSSSSNSEFSLYIPTLKISYSEDKVKLLFWKNGLGKVDRIDFVPIMKTFNDSEPKECQYFKRAFLYIDTRSIWQAIGSPIC